MRYLGAITILFAGFLLATGAEAGPKGHKDNDHGHAQGLACPPGLAKKNPPCVPPGLAHKAEEHASYDHVYEVGHALPEGYVVLFDPALYPYWQTASYVRLGDFLYLIDRLTGAVLLNSGPVEDWTWGWSDVDFAHCPPGLAKKNPPCVPPGQARKGGHVDPYKVGDHLPAGYSVILTPSVETGPHPAVYARLGDSLYRVDRPTGQVLQLIGAISALLH